MKKKLTTSAGIPVGDNQNSLTAAAADSDWQLLRSTRTSPERSEGSSTRRARHLHRHRRHHPLHQGGDLLVAKNDLLRPRCRRARRGRADVRGFALKFYTEEGNWDLVGNNTPVFFVRDPYKFPDFIHTQKRDPKTNLRNPTAMWDFWSLSPESLHQVTILFSDRGIPLSYRHMNGYGSHTYSFINAKNERFWVKFHFKTVQGIRTMTDEDAGRLIGSDRESHQRDLFESIERGEFPKWRVMVQMMPEADAEKTPYNPFDLTKVWPHADYPLIEVGVMELNRNPENYFAEVEQAAFSPANVVPGIGHSPDKMLQFRVVSYADAHRHRIGVNYESLPVNRPRCPVDTYHRDGAMRSDGNGGASVNYEPTVSGAPPRTHASKSRPCTCRPLRPPRGQR